MFIATLRGMLAHRLRLALTTASIALGVAFLAGTLMLTDTMKLAFDQLFGKVSSGTDAVVRQESAYAQSSGIGVSRPPIDASVLDQVRAVHPRIARYIGPPCVIRNGLVSPRCTEGTHFCGVPVWRDFPAAVRRL